MVEKEKLLVQERVIGIIRIKIFQNLMGLKFGSSGVGFEESRSHCPNLVGCGFLGPSSEIEPRSSAVRTWSPYVKFKT